jgi:hypothetical protein
VSVPLEDPFRLTALDTTDRLVAPTSGLERPRAPA